MSEPDGPSVDGLAEEMDRAFVEARELERSLRELDPRTDYRSGGVDVDRGDYPEGGDGSVRYLHALLTGRRDWLLGRYREMVARQAWTAEARERRRAGVSRFIEGRFTLDDLVRPEYERQLDVWRAASQGPVSARSAEQNEAIRAELRGDPS